MRNFLAGALLVGMLTGGAWAAGDWIDISAAVSPDTTPTYPGDPAIDFTFSKSLAKGDGVTVSQLNFGAHTGTHVDAPSHFVPGGKTVDTVPLEVLMGHARVIECSPNALAIDAVELARHDWKGQTRLLFKTRSSVQNFWNDKSFHKDFTYIAPDAARILADGGVKLVGIDYLSVEKFQAAAPEAHRTLLGAGVVIVEGLDLRNVRGGDYDFACLPIRLLGREAAPARAVLRTLR